MDVGKLPQNLLASLLERVDILDPRVVIGPGIGRDAAVIDSGGPRLLVAKSDPITFAGDLIGWYAVQVNANDIACMGALPEWFLATVLLPEDAQPDLAQSIVEELMEASSALGIQLVGGHTEITAGLTRPLVIGAMLGEVERERLVRPDGGRPGDPLILTKGIAIEGTGLLARDASSRLAHIGLDGDQIRDAAGYIIDPGISVLKEAMAVCEAVKVHAMHDPTEGGLATALHEMAQAARCGIVVQEDAVDILPLTQTICRVAALDPLGLLASGALLIAVAPEDCERALDAINGTGVPACQIGSLVAPEALPTVPSADRAMVIMEGKHGRRPLPHFPRDEVARFLTQPDE